MILTCPECSTRYQTDPAQFGTEGRKVRCAKCAHVWHQAPLSVAADPEPEFTAPEESEPLVAATPPQRSAYMPSYESAALTARPESPPPEMGNTRNWSAPAGLAAGWVALAAFVVLIGWAGIRFRQEVAMLWPQSASLYAALGKPVNIRGLEFSSLSYHQENQDGQAVLAITGRLINITSHELSVPRIRMTLTDDDKRVLDQWSFSTGVTTLRPGQAVTFVQRVTSPPSGARHAQAQLAENGE